MNTNTINLKLDLRIVCLVLVVIIATMLGIWRPWESTVAPTTRKITITGQSTVKATPDEFVFNPSFERTGTDLTAMKNDLNSFGTKLLADVEKLGVTSSEVTLDSSSYDSYYTPTTDGTSQTITLQATITVPNKDLAQKVQSYLAGTDAKGQLTAQSEFSTTKQKQLEDTARQQAIDDARKKADQTATSVGAKLGKVLEVSDQSNTGGGCGSGPALICPLASGTANNSISSLPVTPGTSEVSADVQVVFELQ
jgi:uncharacterized protein YggE